MFLKSLPWLVNRNLCLKIIFLSHIFLSFYCNIVCIKCLVCIRPNRAWHNFHFSDIGSLLGGLDGPGGSMPSGSIGNDDVEDINLFDFDGNLTDLDLVSCQPIKRTNNLLKIWKFRENICDIGTFYLNGCLLMIYRPKEVNDFVTTVIKCTPIEGGYQKLSKIPWCHLWTTPYPRTLRLGWSF